MKQHYYEGCECYRPVDDEENLSGECDLEGDGEQVLEQSDSYDDNNCEHIEIYYLYSI